MTAGQKADACEHVRALIDALGDREPGPEEFQEIADHFAECASCNGEEASLEDILALYREQASPPLPARLEQRLLDHLCGEC